MATLTPLTVGNAAAPSEWTTAGNGALGDNSDATFGSVTTNATDDYDQGWELANVDADLGNVDTLSIVLRYRWVTAPANTTWPTLAARVMASDGTTVLAAADSGGTFETVASNITTTTITNSASVPFTHVNTTANKTTWDGAVVQIRISRVRSKGGDSSAQAVYEADLTGTYTAIGPTAVANFLSSATVLFSPTAVHLRIFANLVASQVTVFQPSAGGAQTIEAPLIASSTAVATPKHVLYAYSEAVKELGPTAYWRLGESSGTTASAVFGPDGTYRDIGGESVPTLGVTGLLHGDSNTAISIDDAGDEVQLPNHASLNPVDAISIIAWIKADTFGSNNRRIIQKGDSDNQWRILRGGGSDPNIPGGNIGLHFTLSSGSISAFTPLDDTDTHMLVATYDEATGLAVLYIDGVEVDNTQGTVGLTLNTTTNDAAIGNKPGANVDGDRWDGAVDEVAIFDYALSLAQVESLYAVGSGHQIVSANLLSSAVTVFTPLATGALLVTTELISNTQMFNPTISLGVFVITLPLLSTPFPAD